jgi:hypothetical protein
MIRPTAEIRNDIGWFWRLWGGTVREWDRYQGLKQELAMAEMRDTDDPVAALRAENAKYLACVERLVGDLGLQGAEVIQLKRLNADLERHLAAEEKARDVLVDAKAGAIKAERNMLREENEGLKGVIRDHQVGVGNPDRPASDRKGA